MHFNSLTIDGVALIGTRFMTWMVGFRYEFFHLQARSGLIITKWLICQPKRPKFLFNFEHRTLEQNCFKNYVIAVYLIIQRVVSGLIMSHHFKLLFFLIQQCTKQAYCLNWASSYEYYLKRLEGNISAGTFFNVGN